jgi:hypothetical protein
VSFRSRFLSFTLAAATGLASLSVSRPALADAESDAKDLFARGRDLRSKSDCAAASPLFLKAWKIYPQGLGNLRNYAECEEQLGHFASSRRAWLDIKRALLTAANDPKYEGWDKDAEGAASRLSPKVAVVTVDVTVRTPEGEGPASEKSGVELLLNGEPVAPNLIGTPLERDPGIYNIRIQAPDAQPVEQSVALAAGDDKRVALRIVRTPSDKGAGAIDGHYPGEGKEGGGSSQKTIGWVAIGIGGAALVGSGVTFLLRSAALSDLEEACGPDFENTCPQSKQAERDDAVDQGTLMGTLSPILLGAGVVGVGAGIALLLTSPKSSTRTGLRVYPGLGRIDATWRF